MEPTKRKRNFKDTVSAENLAIESPSSQSRLPDSLHQYSSKLNQMRGPIRMTFDGNLIDEDTGNWLVLDTPPHDAENSIRKEKKTTPAIELPEAKNGATGDKHPRKRMSLGQYVRNSLFSRKKRVSEDSGTLTRRMLHGWVEELQKRGESSVDMQVLEIARRYYGFKIGQKLGGDWFEHALVERKFWLMVLEEVAGTGLDGETS